MNKIALFIPVIAISFLTNCANKNTVLVKVKDSDHLKLLTMDGATLNNVRANKGEDFTFKMEVDDSVNYVIPLDIDIKIGNNPISLNNAFYEIKVAENDDSKATVTIKGRRVIDTINLSINANKRGYYRYNVKYEIEVEHTSVSDPFIPLNNDLEIVFRGIEGYFAPNKEHVFISVDNQPFVSVDKDTKEYCTYDISTDVLHINGSKITNSIVIIARSRNYEMLDDLNWSDINNFAMSGFANIIFYIGEKKRNIYFNNIYHSARIIGFDHDDLVNGEKASITFEFCTVINKSDKIDLIYYNNPGNNHNFINSSFNNYINNDNDGLLNKLPNDLTAPGVLKEVVKKVGVYQNNDYVATKYTTKLFPLSKSELDGSNSLPHLTADEGEQYAYYQNAASINYAKTSAYDSRRYVEYWLRSPSTNSPNNAWFVDSLNHGDIKDFPETIYSRKFGYSPAFCI